MPDVGDDDLTIREKDGTVMKFPGDVVSYDFHGAWLEVKSVQNDSDVTTFTRSADKVEIRER
jgi:hypothetical protein